MYCGANAVGVVLPEVPVPDAPEVIALALVIEPDILWLCEPPPPVEVDVCVPPLPVPEPACQPPLLPDVLPLSCVWAGISLIDNV